MTEHHVLSLGAGVQSTALYLLAMEGRVPAIECAIFADTQDEPAAVYRHLEWLKSLNGPPILVRTRGRISADLARGENATGQRFASIPAFTKGEGDKREGRTRRQCSREYKVEVIERSIRADILNLSKGQRVPKGITVNQYVGISLDEVGRAARVSKNSPKWARKRFPLIEMLWTRADCLNYLHGRVPHQTPRSSCVFCPYHSDAEWLHLQRTDAEGWQAAVEMDKLLRVPGLIFNRNMDKELYLHRSCQPLALVQLDPNPKPRDLQLSMSFAAECLGVCGV